MITHWSDSSAIVVRVWSESRVERLKYPEVRVCVEGEGVGRFDRGVVCWTRNPQQSGVYVLEGEIIYMQGKRISRIRK